MGGKPRQSRPRAKSVARSSDEELFAELDRRGYLVVQPIAQREATYLIDNKPKTFLMQGLACPPGSQLYQEILDDEQQDTDRQST